MSSTLALLRCIGSEKARADSGASAKSGVQNQISVLSRTARPRQATNAVQSTSTKHCHFDVFVVKHIRVPLNISDLFNLKNTQYNLRNSDFELPRFETVRFGRNSLKYMGTSHLVEVVKTPKNDRNSALV